MKLAILADIHGNIHALKAVLNDLAKERPDKIICAGDIVNPYSGSLLVWEELKKRQIIMLKGNHEGYIIKYRQEARNEQTLYNTSIPFIPAKLTARLLSEQIIDEIEQLPLTLTVAGPGGQDVLICHASPTDTRRSFAVGIDKELAAELSQISAPVIVSGHIHEHWQQHWQNKLLLLAGTVGIPFNKQRASEYLILHYRAGAWHPEPRLVPYDNQAAIQFEMDSGLLARGGPIGWLMFDELVSFEMRLAVFMSKIKSQATPPASYREWEKEVITYLTEIGRWQDVKKLLRL